ncbi:MAG: hypothetical protein AAB483_01905 [Patescibacteria group bacterium]
MIFSTRYSYIVLCVGLAAVFFWFGINKFIHPGTQLIYIGTQFGYIQGIFEVLIGLSLVSGVFTRFFSLLGVVLLVAIIVVAGFNEIAVRDLGLIGGLLAIFLWPERR